jgi:amino acid adenylation domain-containing protein
LSNDVLSAPATELHITQEILRGVTLLHQAFELRAAAEPDAVVLVAGDERLTRGELEARANQLARYLVARGVGPEVRVAVCAERTPEMVIALYAVLKAGGAYVPIDPAYPEARQADILTDSGALILLTQERLAGRLPRTTAMPVYLDCARPLIERETAAPLPCQADESNLAYVIYTSGSTGRPKGVAIAHRSAVVLTRWAARIYSPEELAGVLAATSICFDMSIFELFVAPALGGRAILADHALALPDLPAAGEVTLVNTVPSAAAELARSGGIPPGVRTINLGGEALRGALVERLYRSRTVDRVYNVYGPSEDTTFSTWALVPPGDSRPPSIGRLLDGTWGRLLDHDLEPVSDDEAGELYLGGEGLARGYLNRPDLTAARFVPDPFAIRPGERVYTTGDFIRYRQDGELEYLGRIDHQIKIRGFRVELGEIEAVLERHPGVGDTVVAAPDLAPGPGSAAESAEQVLVAYVVPREGATLAVPELREHLRLRLPAHMVPTHFVILAALPLNPNGKVDRAALPLPEAAAGERVGHVAPRTPLEAALAAVWSEILHVAEVGVEDDFFELGGHSLLAARAIARIHDVLGRRLPPRALFDAPTVERLAALLADLAEDAELAGIPAARERSWTASAGQEGMWLAERLSPESAMFTVPLLLELSGSLDAGALRRSLAELVRRHEALRLLFREVNGGPEPALHDTVVDLLRIDLRGLSADDRERQAAFAAAALGRERIDVERGPLMQGTLIELDERDHRLLIAVHHLVADDWSIWILARDLALLYAADVEGRPADLPPLELRYADFAAWQRDWLAGDEAQGQLAFWKRELPAAPQVLALPADRLRPAIQSYRGDQIFTGISRADSEALLGLGQRYRATVFMAFLAALDAMLCRYSGQNDLTVAAPVANRHRVGTQDVVGLFVNSVVLRADLSSDPRFEELLGQVRETVIAGLGHQDFPFDRLVRELEPTRSLSHSPLAQVFLSFQNTPVLPRQLGPGLDLRLHELGNGTSKGDLTIYLRPFDGALVTAWEYATELFDTATIARMGGHFQTLLAAAIADPALRISELPLLTAAEGEQLARWQGHGEPRPADLTLHGMFAAQAARTPQAPAVVAEAGVLSYAELDERSSLLAGHLRALGVGPEVLVGLCLERSLEMVVALLGVLKAGGAYVPLDPEMPAERLAQMAADAGLRVILTVESLLRVLPESRPSTVVCLDGDRPYGPAPGRISGHEPAIDGTSLAYVLFTSGSTGRPKGVAIPQRAIVNHMLWMQSEFPLEPGDKVLQKTPFGFDASVWEFYAPLLAGATLVLARPGGQREPGYLAEVIQQQGITIFQAVPSLLRAMLDDGRLGECGTLRRFFCGGEALTADIQRDFFATLDVELINLYGPTETTIEIASWRCERGRSDRTALLGTPITNSEIRILSSWGELCPAGVPGEICIGGVPVGRGYLDRPAETALHFVPDRFGGEPGARLYRSGDLGRWLPDGTLDFLGRTDHQVKVRGFRIELGEVEAAIASHPAIAEAAVLSDGQRLAAFLAVRPETAVSASDLRGFLRERLPEYMVPSTWTLLESLPHTTSGKVDRRALSLLQPEPAADLPPMSEAPAKPLEKLLAEIWRELGVRVTGVHENFFSLGGHSLLASQVAARIRKTLGVEVAVREIFETPTLAGLATILEVRLPEAPAGPRIEPVDRSGLLPASFIQESLWFLYLLDPASHVYNLPMAWRLSGRLDVAALEAGLEAVVRRHEVLRAVFVEAEGKPFLAISTPAPLALPRIDLSGLPAADRESELARIAALEAGRPFDLARGPLLRACLVLLSRDEENALLLTVHHAVFDGWSEGVLARELAALYEAAITGRSPRLPELPVQYADFAAWQRGWLQGATLDRLVAWWRDELKGSPTLLDLPTDRPRPAVQTFRGGWESLEIPAGAASAILALGRREGATTFMTLLAAFQALLHRLTGQDDLLLGAPVSNRFHPELEVLIGYFVDVVVLRGRFHGEETFPRRLARVRETVLDAFSHQDLPFGQLAIALQPERDLSSNPIFQVMFSLDRTMEPLSLPGLSSQSISSGEPAAKFDLSLTIQEDGGSLGAHLEYNLDLFDPATARRLLERFVILVEAVAADPARRMDAFPLLTSAELQELLAESTLTASVAFPPRCLHDLFSAQAARTPQAVAVLTPAGERLTYAELDQRSSGLADVLVRRGVRPEVRVGVCMERAPEMVIALLGVLKAGGVYLPLDPAYPSGRLSLMLEDSGAAIVLTREDLAGHLPTGRWEVMAIDVAGGLMASRDGNGSALSVPALPDNLAYLIYTSGSTGRPKGVGVSHAAAAEHFEAIVEMLRFGAGDRMLWFSSPSFDASMEEVLTPLICGAAVVLRESGLWSLAEFLDKAVELGITGVDLPTAYWHQLAVDCERVPPPPGLALRQIIVGGEALAGEAARRWRQSPLAGIRLLNSYGPTEATITATVLEVDAAAITDGVVAIGRALAGRSAWVLDRFGQPAPAGSNGELCLGGPLLARGYLGRPGLTAERFVPDPFTAEPGGRLYRTGDLTRRRPDGVVEFVGRIDRQVKVRGFRVESGEIESALARHPAVREVVVDARPDQGGGQRLLAWIVPAGPPSAAVDLAGFLRGTLPDYMIPSAFLMIERLPLTPNGKIDLRALLAPETLAEGLETAVPPRTPTEAKLAFLWEELLGMSRVGVLDSFFDLGGHSLLATRLLSRMRDTFGVEIPFRSLFLAPTVEGLAALVDGARPATLAGTVEMAGGERPARPPLSFAQRSLWLVERLQPAGGAYNLPLALRFSGELDTTALATALGGIVLRHEGLRTRFVEAAGEPWQEVLPAAAGELPLIDLEEIPGERREAEMLRLAADEAVHPFDLAAGPLWRARLFRLNRADHALLLTTHHAVSDGWSNDLIQRDLAALYRAAVAESPAELPPLSLQPADYAVWEREHLRGEVLADLLAVWRRRLAGVPPLELPTDHRRPVSWSFRGASRALPLAITAADLESLVRSRQATPFMVLLACLQVLLGRYAGQDDFAVGTPSANRGRNEVENVVGFFVNMLPLRAELSGAPTFGELLARVRAMALEAFSHQDLPFELLVEALAPERDLGRNPIFQVAFQLAYVEALDFSGMTAHRFALEGNSAKFDLNFAVAQEEGRLALSCEYSVDLYEGTTIQRLFDHFQTLVAGALANPDCKVGDLPLLTTGERGQLLVGFNDTGATSGPELCLHQLFEAQAARIPDQVALVAPDARLTYRELNERADRLARRLRSLGLGPESLAGVLMDRTADLIVTLLAIHKAGGAYAPLDPNYPRQRVLLMLETSGAQVLVTRRRLAQSLGDDLPPGMRTVLLDPGWESETVKENGETRSALPDNLAYVIFTSGSTGVPKGVAIQHRSAVAMIRWAHGMYTPEEYAGVLASTSICFDMSVFEIFATLGEGGKLILAENALALPELEAKDEVVLVDTVPSAMAELLRLGRLPPSIRTVNLGGEPLKDSLVREIYAGLPNVERVVNLYGPSEDTTFTSFSVVPRDAEHPLIGRPLTGEMAYVLDAGMQPVPLGIPGALYMGGEGVTRGYLGRPELTAERFIPNPYGPPGSRLYAIGDLVRYLPTGELDFLGRLDHQVKVRGYRVELGEIESALTRHPEIQDAAVLALPEEGGGNRLIAWIETPGDLPTSELRAFLKTSLPDYMVPSGFVSLRELPLTPNGKIDRRALAALPLHSESAGPQSERPPRSYAEEVLAGIWSEIFNQSVGMNDNFFDLGGHSLLATRVVSRVREAFGVELPLRRLFEQPTVATLAVSIEAALGAGSSLELPRIERVPRTGPLPLSFSQRRLWFLDQLSPGSAVYNVPHPLEIAGRLDPQILKAALSEVVRRHEALRTTFPSLDGEPVQVIAPADPFPLPTVDLRSLHERVRSREAARLLANESLRPFDLGAGPTFRTVLVRLHREQHLLLLTMHHIVADGWSLEVLVRELVTLYEAFAAGRPSPLPELPVQYADFAVWQRRWLTGQTLARQLDYWRRRLAGAPAGLDLPTDFPRPAIQTFNGATRSAALPVDLAQALKAFCHREGVTLFMLLLAGFDVLLARYSGQEDVLVGSPIANRNRAETEGLIGFFVNTLVLRNSLETASSFGDVLRQTRESALAAYGHQDLPFETLVEELRPERDLSRSPFFQVLFSLQTLRGDLPGTAGLTLSAVGGELDSAKFDLSLFVTDGDAALTATVEYNTDLFAAATAGRLLGHFGQLLAAAVSDPERGWRDLPLLTVGEREQLLVGFNDTGSSSGPELCLHQLFEAQVARIPDQVALVAPDARLTYRDLDDRADRLARRLRSLGLGPESLAGVLMDRTADLVVTLLAIHKAGGAYAPLDPNYPRQRVLLMLETSRARVLVTRRRLAASLGDELPAGMRTVFLDPGWESEPVAEDGELGRALPDNLAYVIFTSGSTGVPKGVAIQHRSAVAMIRWAHGMYTPEEYAGVLASTSICFDMSVFEIFATLGAGGTLILAENALALPGLEAKDEVVLVDMVPSAMAELLRLGRLPPSIRTVNLGGEPLKGSLVREIYAGLPNVERVVNLYGPSEDTTFTSFSVVPRDAEHPLIGRPLTGESAYVLDGEMRPVPLGIPGALYMGGEGVTRGYLGRPELTAERFIPNPYGPPGSRLYTIGDLVRYLPTGELDFLGRLDHQVKVRGYRVELGEIESALTRHPEVQEAAVLALSEESGGNRLIAWIEAPRDLASGELRAFLKTSLPDYMVPSAFVTLRELPLTPNGKIDRRALAAMPRRLESAAPAEDRAPRSHAEEMLVRIWSEIFGHAVGVNENFFDLGGHSLLATRVVSRVREAFGIELPLRRLFEQPTVAELAGSVGAALATGASPAVSHTGPLAHDRPLSFGQRRLWFLDQLLPDATIYNVPWPLDLDGKIDPPVLAGAFAAVVRRHEALRTIFPSLDGEPCQQIDPAGEVPLPLVDLGGLPEEARDAETRALTRMDAVRPFDLGVGPLLRTALLRLGRERHRLLLTLHHIVADGWSMEILLRELLALYEAIADGRPSPLPGLPMQYADFAAWQLRWLSGETLARQLDFWRGQLDGAPAGLDLSTDFPRPAVQTFHGASRSLALPAELVAGLRAFCRREGVTLFMLLLAGFDVLLARYSGQDDILVGSPVANRNRMETEGLIGFFVNTLVLRARLSTAPSFRDLLRQVRETALEAFDHQDLPFETLVEELRPERDLSRSPFFQVLFSLQTLRGELPGLECLKLSLADEEIGSAKFDLSLFVTNEDTALTATVEYNTDLFAAATAGRLLGHLERLLAAAVSDPERGWRDLPLLTAGEREQLLVGFNDTGSTAGSEFCLHQLFEAQVARIPDQVALIATDARLTYRELNDRADRLARRLRSLGLGPEGLAGVLMDRTADLIVTLLAIHKAGGAYAPLDPNYPRQRVLLMLETSGAGVLVTRRRLAESLGDALPAGMRTVFLDPGWESEPVAEDGEIRDALPDNLAYVIFTSGSTGVPKGVAIQHHSAVAMIRWAHGMYTPEEYGGVLASTSICFDMSVFEIFATLGEGGTLILAENALALPDLEAKDEVVLVDTVPSAMAELLRLGRLPASIRTVNLGGEPLKGSLVREIYAGLPNVERVVNLYGPSEDTTFTSFSVVPRDAEHPLIGRPLTGETAYVLDGEMRPVPLGIPGALYMGGEGVTRGYLGRPELTAERFIPNPFGPAGSRLYAIGDLVRYLPTGELDFLGRLDHQVKVRGFRIELGEIEAALTLHPDLRDAAVLAIPEADGAGNRLIAYVETDRATGLAAELRALLKQSLPDYMVPSGFVPLRELPLTPNGKIDRRALAAIPSQPESAGEASRAPRNYVEEVLVGVWSEVFDRAVGVGDNFFDLGGHSLLATRVVSRIRSVLDVELPLQQIFAAPTVEGLAVLIEQEMKARRGVPLPPIARASRERELPLSFAQQRLWFLDRLEGGTAAFNLPAPLRLTGRLNVAALSRALDEIVRRHETLRTRFGDREGRGYQEVLPPASVPLPRIDLSGLPEAVRETESQRWADAEARLPFDLAHGPLLRTTLMQLGPEDWLLLATQHHIVSDGWSTDVFTRELRVLHEAFAAGLPSPLPELPLQYPDFAVWQREALDGEALEALLGDWTRRFGTSLPPLLLPTDRPRPALQSYLGGYRSLQLTAELGRDVQALARRFGVTLFMALLGAFQALLYRYTGQERIVVGSPVAGRGRPELEGLIGFFVNTLVLPADLAGDLTVRQLLERTRDMALGAYAAQDLPFEKLVQALQPVRDNSRSPLFQAMFLLHQPVHAESKNAEGALRVEPFGADTGTSQFDLTLFAADEPEGDNPTGLLVGVEYNTDLFDVGTMDHMLEHYRSLLQAAVANPGIRLADLPVSPLTVARQVVMTVTTAASPEPKPETRTDSRRDRLSSRLSKLSPAQLEALERRRKGTSETTEAPVPSARCLVEIVPAAPGAQGRPFFCIHPAGGDVLCFFPLARLIGSDQAFYGLQARGLEDAAEPFGTIEEMAAHYVTEIRSVQPSGPYRVGGWSFGGLAAFELAQQLCAAGETVELLVVMDTAPGVEADGGPATESGSKDNTGWLLTIAEYVKGLRGKDLAVTAADLRPLDEEAQLRFFVERLQRAGVVHSGDSLEQLRRLLRVYKTNVQAYRAYVPRPYAGPITLIRAEQAAFPPELGPDLGWDQLTPHPIDHQQVPGDHITLLAEPHVRTLADRLRTRLGGSERS